MAIELHHLNTHGMMEQACDVLDGVVRLKERIAELEKENGELRSKNEGLLYALADAETDLAMSHRWRKFSEEKPSEEMEGEDFLVSNGYYSVVCEWRGYWNNYPFCGDRHCDVVKYWIPLPAEPKEKK